MLYIHICIVCKTYYTGSGDKVILIAYYFDVTDGVGARRSRFLYNMLLERSIKVRLLSKDSWGEKSKKSKLLWLFYCVFFLFNSVRQNVYISCGPFWHLALVAVASGIKGHNLFVDFRDPWSLNIKKEKNGFKKYVRLCLSVLVERMVYAICKKFIVCTPGMFIMYASFFQDESKMSLVLNGHEIESNFLKHVIDNRINTETCKVVCVGKFLVYGKSYLKKYKDLCEKLDKTYKNYRVYFVGTDKETEVLLEKEKNTFFLPSMIYEEAMKFISDADLSIISIRDEEFDLGTKVYDYIALGIPIYDWFDHNKSFYLFFKDYMCGNLQLMSSFQGDIQGKFYRKNFLEKLCNLLENEEGGL